jgi:hypothetical protein
VVGSYEVAMTRLGLGGRVNRRAMGRMWRERWSGRRTRWGCELVVCKSWKARLRSHCQIRRG